MKGSARDRGALGFSLSYNLKDKLLVRNYLTVNKVKSKESPYGDFSQYALLNPYYPFQDEHGNLIRKMTQYINTNKQIWNPVYEATVGNRDESEYLDVTIISVWNGVSYKDYVCGPISLTVKRKNK